MQLPIVPAPRAFRASGETCVPSVLTLREHLGPLSHSSSEDAYELELRADGAVLRAATPLGLLRGRSSWRQLQSAGTVPGGVVQDAPRFGWRGFMLDVSRHFYPVADVKRVLDRLAELKFNRFHWHLIDDQGWRLEIAGYPRFTEVGAWRTEKDGSRYGGFYTAAEVADVVRYAEERGIVVVPEIELPGHSLAGLASYPELSCTGAPEDVTRKWGIFDGVYCASSEPAALILEAVIDEIARLFPGPWIHIGGDEVVRTRWEQCPRCQAKIRDENLDGVAGLEAAFFRRFLAHVKQRGKTPIGWNELFEHAIDKDIPVQWWHRPDLARKTLEAGNPLLVSDVEYCYFDYPYRDEDPWFVRTFMKLAPTEKVYANPVIPAGCEAWADQIQGGEACLWSEQAPPPEFENRVRGRLEAFAEVYWSFDTRPGFENFVARMNHLGKDLGR